MVLKPRMPKPKVKLKQKSKPKIKTQTLLQNERMSALRINVLKSTVYKPGRYSKNFIKNIKFRTVNDKRVLLGKGSFGEVYLGNLEFQDGSRKKVAIKLYKMKATRTANRDINKLQENFIIDNYKRYEEALEKLKRINIPEGLINNKNKIPIIPKCDVLLINGQIVFVSPAYSSLKNNMQTSKFIPNTHLPDSQNLNYNKKKIFLETAVYSIGGVATKDLFMKFKGRNNFMLLDLDSLVFYDKIKPEERSSAFINDFLENTIKPIKKQKTKERLLEYTKRMLREDKGNFDTDFKKETLHLLDRLII